MDFCCFLLWSGKVWPTCYFGIISVRYKKRGWFEFSERLEEGHKVDGGLGWRVFERLYK